jgi:hypothetical protein
MPRGLPMRGKKLSNHIASCDVYECGGMIVQLLPYSGYIPVNKVDWSRCPRQRHYHDRTRGITKTCKKMSRICTALVLSEQEEQGLRQITRRHRAWLSNAGKDLVRKSLSQGLVGFELLDPLHLLPIPLILRIRCCEPRIQNLLSNGFRCRS